MVHADDLHDYTPYEHFFRKISHLSSREVYDIYDSNASWLCVMDMVFSLIISYKHDQVLLTMEDPGAVESAL